MKKLTLFFTALCLSVSTIAKPVESFDQAVDLVRVSVEKNKLTLLKKNCLLFDESEQTKTEFIIDVREKHNVACGGDPQTAPRLMTYKVQRKTGRLCTDSVEWAKRLNVEDPYDFECRTIK